jgi:hypothetical protein
MKFRYYFQIEGSLVNGVPVYRVVKFWQDEQAFEYQEEERRFYCIEDAFAYIRKKVKDTLTVNTL